MWVVPGRCWEGWGNRQSRVMSVESGGAPRKKMGLYLGVGGAGDSKGELSLEAQGRHGSDC